MTLSLSYRATCNAPRCRASELLPHAVAKHARSQLKALGWTFLRWRFPQSGMKYTRYGDYVEVADTGGGVRKIDLCPKHREWRPKEGVEIR